MIPKSITLEDITMFARDRDGSRKRYLELTCGYGEPYYFKPNSSNSRIPKIPFKIGEKKILFPKYYYRLGEECPICLEEIINERTGWKTSCGHLFHKKCLRESFLSATENCPFCRGSIGNIEFIEGITYSVYEICYEKNALDVLEEVDNLVTKLCYECDGDLGMNKDCQKCLNYRQDGSKQM